MAERRKVIVSWSSGKDSAWTLQLLRQNPAFEVVGLMTTVAEDSHKVRIHAVRSQLLGAQEAATGIPLLGVAIPWPCPSIVYEARVGAALRIFVSGGIRDIAFGDIFLQDLRAWRERRLVIHGVTPVFPLWGRNTGELAREMIAGGLRAVVTSVDTRRLDRSFAGRPFDEAFLRDLPREVDPCGERGEFHTFVHAGPMFTAAIPIRIGTTEIIDGFAFADVDRA